MLPGFRTSQKTARPAASLMVLAALTSSLLSGAINGRTIQYADFHTQHVVLRTGSVYSGIVERTNDQVTVLSENGVSVKLNRSEVDFITDSIDYAADRLANRIVDDNPQSHEKLANWCLRYGALKGAQRELEWLSAADYSKSELRELQRRLEFILTSSTATTTKPVLVDNSAGSKSDLPRTFVHSEYFLVRQQLQIALDSISKDARRDFTSKVHNRILNGCAAAQCHGNPATGMRLWRDGATGLESTSAQRNLLAILSQTDRQAPDNSPLLSYMTTAHGGQAEPAFVKDSPQWTEIRDWIESVVIADEMAAESSKSISQASLQTPVASSTAGLEYGVEPPKPVDLLSHSEISELSADPYNPEHFNRLYSGPDAAAPTRTNTPVPSEVVTAPERHSPQPDVEPVKKKPVVPVTRKTRPLPPVDDDDQ